MKKDFIIVSTNIGLDVRTIVLWITFKPDEGLKIIFLFMLVALVPSLAWCVCHLASRGHKKMDLIFKLVNKTHYITFYFLVLL